MTFRAKKKNKKSPSSAEEMKKSIDCQQNDSKDLNQSQKYVSLIY